MLTVLSAGRFSGKVTASVHLCISYLGSVPESGLHSFVNLQENKHFFFVFFCTVRRKDSAGFKPVSLRGAPGEAKSPGESPLC